MTASASSAVFAMEAEAEPIWHEEGTPSE